MLDVLNVSKYYGALAAGRNFSFTARRREVLGYLGPNGSGQSTTVNMVAGHVEPTSGEIPRRRRGQPGGTSSPTGAASATCRRPPTSTPT